MDTKAKGFSEKNQVKEKKEKKVHDCPQCHRKFTGMRCACGYTHPIKERLETDGSVLKRLERTKRVQLSRSV